MSISLNPELHKINRLSQKLLFEQILSKKIKKRSVVFQNQYSKFSFIDYFNFLAKKIIFLSHIGISKKLFFDFIVVDLNNFIFKRSAIDFFFLNLTGINFELYENILRNVKYSLNSSGIVTFLYSNDMHTYGTNKNCLSFEQWSEDFFSHKLKLLGFNNQVIELERVDKHEFVICHCWSSLEKNDYKPIVFK